MNDAPALKKADIGIAMILLDDNFAGIASAVEEGRAVFGNLRKFISYVLTSNVPELVPYLAFALLGIPLPLTIIQILLVDLGTDMLPALGLGADPPDPGGMQKAPRTFSCCTGRDGSSVKLWPAAIRCIARPPPLISRPSSSVRWSIFSSASTRTSPCSPRRDAERRVC